MILANNSLKQANKKIVPLALTMAGTQLIVVGSGFLCMIMLSRLGHEVLAASALMISTQISVMVIAMSMLFSLSILVGHCYGAQKFTEIGNYMQQGWTLAILLCIPVIVLLWNMSTLLKLFGQPPQVLPLIEGYFHAYVWAVPPFLLSICNQQLCYGIHKQRIVILTSSTSVLVLLATAYLLIFGQLGLPQLGTAGLGYAMAAQGWFSLIFMFLLLKYHSSFQQFGLFDYRLAKSWVYFKQMFKIGWPISIQISGEMLSFFVVSVMVGWIGTNALAAGQIVNQFIFLIVVPVFAISQASGIAIGQAYGSKRLYDVKNLGYASLQLALMISISCAIIFLLFPKFLASFYLRTSDPFYHQTLQLTKWLFMVCAAMQIVDSVRNVLTGALRGLLDTKFPMVVGIFSLWAVGIPCSYIFGFIFKWGLVGIALGSTTGMLIGAIMISMRWRKQTSDFPVFQLQS